MRILYLLLIIPCYVSAEINLDLQSQLLEMAKVDQEIRKELGESGWHKSSKALQEKALLIDERNTQQLKSILNGRSWFTEAEVGKEGINSAWLIVQHSPDIDFQEKMLPLLEQSYLNREGVTGQEVALLTDRVRIDKGQKQLYGTQANWSDGAIVFKPIENPETVDERRAEMGMPPLEFYKKLLEEMYGLKDHPDIDLN
ncbi:DUF6624 domain-containing protein [Photobacterium sp. 53610]|uniref:DUF6624 domain-containing protein n=1 Tax=Photobacterium sp. 53610 TaxID=3102789 RepID=UPI002EDB1031